MASPRIDALDNVAVKLSYIDAPHSTISNRAQVVDLENDLKAHGPLDRFRITRIEPIPTEFGSGGQVVWKPSNDRFEQTRLAGQWRSIIDSNGVRVQGEEADDYIEFTFYGTGVNLLTIQFSGGSRDYRASIDGGAEGVNIYENAAITLTARSTTANQIVPVASGLAQGIHTVRIRNAGSNNLIVCGFEVLNEGTQIRVNPGSLVNGKSLIAHTSAFSGSFDLEQGTDVGAGGCVVLYEEGGSIKKAVRWAPDNQQNLAAADHTNEQVNQFQHFREFGTGRTDDLSTLQQGVSDRAGS
jgi:hypothetical protein